MRKKLKNALVLILCAFLLLLLCSSVVVGGYYAITFQPIKMLVCGILAIFSLVCMVIINYYDL